MARWKEKFRLPTARGYERDASKWATQVADSTEAIQQLQHAREKALWQQAKYEIYAWFHAFAAVVGMDLMRNENPTFDAVGEMYLYLQKEGV